MKLMDEKGQMQFSEAAKAQVATDYFNNLFKAGSDGNFDQMFEGFSAKVTATMNELLTREVTNEEVRDAVFSIKPGSAPGPDGMSGLFFRSIGELLANMSLKRSRISLFIENFQENGTTLICVCYPR